MHTSKFPVLACAAAGIVSCFLPWANSLVLGQPKTLNGLQFGEGYLTLVCFVLIVANIFFHGSRLPFSIRQHKLLATMGIITAAGLYYKIVLMQNQAAKMLEIRADIDHYVIYNPTIGIYITAAAALGITLSSIYRMLLQYKPVVPQNSWFDAPADAEVTGRFYLPS